MNGGYQARLAAMEDWYRQLVALDEREQMILQDYAPHRQFLQSLTGHVIDIGGGAGIAARFIQPQVHYVVVDPSEVWDSREWIAFSRNFRESGPVPDFFKAGGESLPFDDEQFDVALSFWSLNHVSDPARCVSEMIRVLKPGGTARLVLEDMEPSWSDLITDGAARVRARLARQHRLATIPKPLMQALTMKVRKDWPHQDDHIRIAERDLRAWFRDRLQVRRREWLGGFLTFDLVKP